MDPLVFLQDEMLLMHIFSFLGGGKGQGIDTVHHDTTSIRKRVKNGSFEKEVNEACRKVENHTTAMGPCVREILLLSRVSKGWKKIAENTSFQITNVNLSVDLIVFRDAMDAIACLNWLVDCKCSVGSLTGISADAPQSYLPQFRQVLLECNTTNLMLVANRDLKSFRGKDRRMVFRHCPNLLFLSLSFRIFMCKSGDGVFSGFYNMC